MLDLDNFTVSGTTRILSRRPLRLITPPKPWEYAITIPIDQDEIDPSDGPMLVTIDATVHVGRIGFGVVAADLATYLGEEVQQSIVTDTPPPLVVPSVSAGGWLVVRNLSDDGRASEVTLRSLTVSPGDNSPNRSRVPRGDEQTVVSERWGAAPDDAVNWATIPMLRRRAADFNSVFSQYLDRSARVSRVLSLCCGHGHFERTILQLLSYDHCDSLDISEPALEHARELAREAGILNVNYERCDVNTLQLSQEYDLVFGGGIHHLSNLEHVFSEVARWLCPGAPFMMYEYIGPNRCQPTERQLEAINACIRLLPEKYRMRVSAQREMNVGSADEAMDILRRKRADMRGLSDCDNTDRFSSDPLFAKFFWQRYTPMTVEQWQTVDPSESVRSEDILPVLRQYFSDVDVRYQGGSILQFTLFDLAANFCYESPEVRALLKMLIHVEDVLTTFDPDIPQDYAVIIARNP